MREHILQRQKHWAVVASVILAGGIGLAIADEGVEEQRAGVRITAPVTTQITAQTLNVSSTERYLIIGGSLSFRFDPTEVSLSTATSVVGNQIRMDVSPLGVMDGCAIVCSEYPDAAIDMETGYCTAACPPDGDGNPQTCLCASCYVVCPECDWWDLECIWEDILSEAGLGTDGELKSFDRK